MQSMMSAPVYEAFIEAGVTKEKAKIAALSIGDIDRVATKDNFTELKGEIAEVKSELKGEIARVDIKLSGEIAEVRGEIARVDIKLSGEIAEVKSEVNVMKWMIGFNLVFTATMLIQSMI